MKYAHATKLKQASGAIMPLAALLLPLIILVVGFIVWLMGAGAAREQIQGGARMVGLAAVEQYFATPCDPALSIDACNSLKLDAAKTRAQNIANSNTALIGSVAITTNSAETDKVLIEPTIYHAARPPNSDPCGAAGYPCVIPRPEGQVANAIRISGTISNTPALRLSKALGVKLSNDVKFNITTTAVPIHVAYVIDISSSIAENTHLPRDTVIGGTTIKQSYFSMPLQSDIEGPFADISGVKYSLPMPLPVTWDGIGAAPTPRPSNSKYHYQDDYKVIETFTSNPDGYNTASTNHDATIPNYHPSPGEGSNIYSGEAPGADHFLVDFHRQASVYDGPEPYRSAMRGVKKALQLLANRRVAGDKATLIFYDTDLFWHRVFKLTDDLDYLQSVLNIDALSSQASLDSLWQNYSNSSNLMQLGPLLRNKLFPMALTYTNTTLAFAEANRQLFTEGNTHPDGTGTTPSVDVVVHFSDGLANCADGTCDANSYMKYRFSINAIKAIAANNFYPRRITVNAIHFGTQGGPHTLALLNGSSGCLSEDDARKQGKDIVHGADYPNENAAQQTFNDRFNTPFWTVAKDWFDIAVMTGGIYAPIRPLDPGCASSSSVPTNCITANPVYAERITTDRKCRSIETQIDQYLGKVFSNSHAFVIVDAH